MKVGVYIHDGFTFEPRDECPYYWGLREYRRYLDWLRASRIDIVEYCQQLGWYRYPTLPAELDRLGVRQGLIGESHGRGMEFWLILGTNLYSRLPPGEIPVGQLELDLDQCMECPQDGDGFRRTAELSRYYARVFRGADAFEIFAGDWGGCNCGRCDVGQYIRYVNYHAQHLSLEQPAAQVWANLWSISSWAPEMDEPDGGFSDPRWRRFWDSEITVAQRFLASLDDIPLHVGISFPLHHWYRGFCQLWYAEEDLPDWPDIPLLMDLHRAGRRVLAWAHFIVENDPSHGRLWGTLSVRLRYIRDLCQRLVGAPFGAVMGNVYSARQALNLYALSRFARTPDISVETVLSGFVNEVALPSGAALLGDLLVFLENRDPWHEDMPQYRRLPPLPEESILPNRLRAALPYLARHLRADAPLLLTGRDSFARTIAAAFALHD